MAKLNNFQQRTLTGVLFVAAILGSLLHPVVFSGLFLLVLMLSLHEYRAMLRARNVDLSILPYAMGLVVYGGIYYIVSVDSPLWLELGLVAVFFVFALLVVELYRKKEDPMGNIVFGLFSVLYLTLPYSLLLPLYDISPLLVLAVFVMVWANDTFAYLVGVRFGKHRLFERISPKKSWEGAVGGLFFALLTGLVFSYFSQQLSALQWIGMAAIVVVFSTLGDLFESLFKRSLGVKDSGAILPGHGGILDRFDSILFAVPAVIVYLLFI